MKVKVGLDRIQVFGFTLSVVLATGLILAGQGKIESLILGVATAAMTNQFAIHKRMAELQAALLDAGALSRKLYEDPWLLRHVSQIIEDYGRVSQSWYDIFRERARFEVQSCFETLHNLAEGRMRFERKSPFSFGSAGIEQAAKTLHATTTTAKPYGEFWSGEAGLKYLRKNQERITDNVDIVRVFIVNKSRIQDDLSILRQHRNAGVKVYVAWEHDLEPELRENFIIMDGKLVTTTILAANGRVKDWVTAISEPEVERFKRMFDVIRRNAKSLDEVEIALGLPEATITRRDA